ncbi:MAG: hypothetical protein ACU843_00120 [Gammaproteobacteria bacterium]
MKKAQTLFGILLSLIASCLVPVHAEVTLQSKDDVAGLWKLEGSGKDLNGAKRPGQQTWEFKKDGTLTTVGFDRRLPGGDFSVSSSYEIKDGKIVADVVGRPGKKTSYTVIEKDDNSMIIKEGIGEYLFFTKK